MKQTDFDRLKAVCEKEGFEISNEIDTGKEKYLVLIGVKEKDIWEGVKFGECIGDHHYFLNKGTIYRRVENKSIDDMDCFYYEDSKASFFGTSTRQYFKPSTESAYIEQLKAEAFKRFGEIKEGDRFDRSWAYEHWPNPAIIDRTKRGFGYESAFDQLTYNGSVLYEQGKWATRVKERVKVVGAEMNKQSMTFYYTGKIDEMIGNISIKIEEYLNKD